MRKTPYIVCGFLSLLIFLGCKQPVTQEPSPTSVTNIAQILMHEQGFFTFLVQREDGGVGRLIIRVVNPYEKNRIIILRDTTENEPIKVEYKCDIGNPIQCREVPTNFSVWCVNASSLTIHLHSAKEINGAGWNHGKFGQGQVTNLE